MEHCPTLNLGLGDGKPDMTVAESATDITWRYGRGYLLYVGNRRNNTYRGTRGSPSLSRNRGSQWLFALGKGLVEPTRPEYGGRTLVGSRRRKRDS